MNLLWITFFSFVLPVASHAQEVTTITYSRHNGQLVRTVRDQAGQLHIELCSFKAKSEIENSQLIDASFCHALSRMGFTDEDIERLSQRMLKLLVVRLRRIRFYEIILVNAAAYSMFHTFAFIHEGIATGWNPSRQKPRLMKRLGTGLVISGILLNLYQFESRHKKPIEALSDALSMGQSEPTPLNNQCWPIFLETLHDALNHFEPVW